MLQVQEQVARAVAGNLELRITAGDRPAVLPAGAAANSRRRSELYLIARSHARGSWTAPSNQQAIALYQQIHRADPAFALAQGVAVARAVGNQPIFHRPAHRRARSRRSRPLLAEAEKARAATRRTSTWYGADLLSRPCASANGPMRDMRHALEIEPNSVAAASALGFYYLTSAEPREALTYYTIGRRRWIRATSAWHALSAAWSLTDLGQYPEGPRPPARRRGRSNPSHPGCTASPVPWRRAAGSWMLR